MFLGYGIGLILSIGFRAAFSRRDNVFAREELMMIKFLMILKLVIEILIALMR